MARVIAGGTHLTGDCSDSAPSGRCSAHMLLESYECTLSWSEKSKYLASCVCSIISPGTQGMHFFERVCISGVHLVVETHSHRCAGEVAIGLTFDLAPSYPFQTVLQESIFNQLSSSGYYLAKDTDTSGKESYERTSWLLGSSVSFVSCQSCSSSSKFSLSSLPARNPSRFFSHGAV